ncbi:TIGR03618 family F420-dependent PPOX class oxidoreductase [Nocardioides sp. CFH 31398]|uniref:TIGR03618 family F420-dependent PPOX class oxidoreductase n=1 Tax=Nocardioides sp. CFH 31398 TaxID=2919579 RepID=UPI001F06D606|nr:TIGR03618 family F420-dependent PPOX class oxidoreductase [Nocardioides sp. CFH 31398]MCH1865801.1 TIGR03618 family F420-dependent PPOX class oxidoreductase [Nocardioides sp. CFH 31398]
MPEAPLPDDVRAFLAKPNPCTMTTLRKDGTPVSVATWYLHEVAEDSTDRILLNMDVSRVRVKHVRRDPRVALTMLDEADWYTHVSLLTRITEIVDDPDLTDIDRLARHYRGQGYPDRESPRVSAWATVERWHGWGAMKD